MIENLLFPDEKRHKDPEIRVYKSLVIAAVILLGTVLLAAADSYGLDVLGFAIILVFPAVVALVVILVISVVGLFRCSWSGRIRLLLWYACLFTAILILEPIVPGELQNYILLLGAIVLLILPAIWLWNAFRS